MSDENNTEFTPAGWTFSIWGIIYFWQAAWLLYAISRIPRKSNEDYLYIIPDTLHYFVFVFYILNMILNISWLFLWDREYFGVRLVNHSREFRFERFVLGWFFRSSVNADHRCCTVDYYACSSST